MDIRVKSNFYNPTDPLEPDEELFLVTRWYELEDHAALEWLWQSHKGLVDGICWKYKRVYPNIHIDELRAAGHVAFMEGLRRDLRRFDPARSRLCTYLAFMGKDGAVGKHILLLADKTFKHGLKGLGQFTAPIMSASTPAFSGEDDGPATIGDCLPDNAGRWERGA